MRERTKIDGVWCVRGVLRVRSQDVKTRRAKVCEMLYDDERLGEADGAWLMIVWIPEHVTKGIAKVWTADHVKQATKR